MNPPLDLTFKRAPAAALSAEEIAERRAIAEQTDAHQRIEGMPPSSAFAAELREKWINGEISHDERIAALNTYYRVNG